MRQVYDERFINWKTAIQRDERSKVGGGGAEGSGRYTTPAGKQRFLAVVRLQPRESTASTKIVPTDAVSCARRSSSEAIMIGGREGERLLQAQVEQSTAPCKRSTRNVFHSPPCSSCTKPRPGTLSSRCVATLSICVGCCCRDGGGTDAVDAVLADAVAFGGAASARSLRARTRRTHSPVQSVQTVYHSLDSPSDYSVRAIALLCYTYIYMMYCLLSVRTGQRHDKVFQTGRR